MLGQTVQNQMRQILSELKLRRDEVKLNEN
jgi:hypothetical protein